MIKILQRLLFVLCMVYWKTKIGNKDRHLNCEKIEIITIVIIRRSNPFIEFNSRRAVLRCRVDEIKLTFVRFVYGIKCPMIIVRVQDHVATCPLSRARNAPVRCATCDWLIFPIGQIPA